MRAPVAQVGAVTGSVGPLPRVDGAAGATQFEVADDPPCPSTVAALEHPAHAAWPRYGKLVAPHLAVQLLDRRYGAGGRTAEDCPQ